MILKLKANNQFKRSVFCLFVSAVLITALMLCTIGINSAFAESGEQTEVHMGQTVKVGLKYGSNAVSGFTLDCDSGFCVVS